MAARFGKYELVKKLASGGMGEVFLARAGREKPLVLKRILPHLAENKEFLDLFLDEARIAARLNHPNVAQIFELGDVDGSWYLLMEYVPGKDLRQVSQTARSMHRPLPLGLACRVIADAAAGLDYAHRAKDAQGRPMQIVHRDVSPHNVLVSFDGAVKLIDFGVAKAVGRLPQTEAGLLRGKYPYMSPEQVDVAELDHRSDQFSLGVVLWELLAADRLFKGSSDAVTLQQVSECVVEAPARKGEAIPRGLIEIVMCALQKDPKNRFADTATFRLALEGLITAEQWPASNAHLGTFIQALFPEGADGKIAPDEDSARSSRSVAIAAPRTSFIGRAAELEALRHLISRGERLLTLLGPGGAGKTRLAIQLALESPAASLADLTDATDLEGLCAAVARALGVTLASGKTAEDAVAQLGRSLGQRSGLLLVLDPFEQRAPWAADTVGKWRAAAPNVAFVVTGREGLKVPGERVWEVPPLAEGVELFLERARTARPGWTPTETERKSVEELIGALEGMPLAIELVAARLAMSSPAQVLQRPDVSARQATLRGTIDGSWDLLQGHEQLALAQLSVFGGGFTLEAAEAVISLTAFPKAPWALDVVQALRDKSLVRTWEAAGLPGELRFGLFESIRAYAAEKLGAEAERNARARHAAWCLSAAGGKVTPP